jgi:hypothetical protein
VLIAGRGQTELDLWQLYTNESQLLGFVMSGMTVPELAAAAEWINAMHRVRPLTVSIGDVLGFDAAAHAHAVIESGESPRLSDGTVGRIVLTAAESR